jgi:hypothetical protein
LHRDAKFSPERLSNWKSLPEVQVARKGEVIYSVWSNIPENSRASLLEGVIAGLRALAGCLVSTVGLPERKKLREHE